MGKKEKSICSLKSKKMRQMAEQDIKGKISEIFFSVQGEGIYAGVPCSFVRVFGCNKQCSYCDTVYSRTGKYRVMTPRQVISEIKEGLPVVITGGEPTLQKRFLKSLLPRLGSRKIFLETNGTGEVADIIEYLDHVCVHIDPLPSSFDRRFIKSIAAKPFSAKFVITDRISMRLLAETALFLKNVDCKTMILQPEFRNGRILKKSVKKALALAAGLYGNYPFVRVIPQIHRILRVR